MANGDSYYGQQQAALAYLNGQQSGQQAASNYWHLQGGGMAALTNRFVGIDRRGKPRIRVKAGSLAPLPKQRG